MSCGRIGLIGGTGLEKSFLSELKNQEYKTVDTPFGSPSDKVLLGTIYDVEIALLPRHGRTHGFMPTDVNYSANVWALKTVGCKIVIAFSAVGSLVEEFAPGHLSIITDAIDRTVRFPRSLYTGAGGKLGDQICHMHASPLCNVPLQNVIRQQLCNKEKYTATIVHPESIITVIEGPRFSTKAESLLHKSWGAHLVGMTLMPEAPMAKEAGLAYACIAMVTDYDCWKEDESVTSAGVLETMAKNGQNSIHALKLLLPAIKSQDWTKSFSDINDDLKHSLM